MAYSSTIDVGIARKGVLSRLFDAMMRFAERQSRADRVAALESLSDAELAARGVRRDRIVEHVFRDKMYI